MPKTLYYDEPGVTPMPFIIEPDPRISKEFYELLERLHLPLNDEEPHDYSHDNVILPCLAACVDAQPKLMNVPVDISLRIIELKIFGSEDNREVLFYCELLDYDLKQPGTLNPVGSRTHGYGRLNLRRADRSSLVLCASDGQAYDGYHAMEDVF